MSSNADGSGHSPQELQALVQALQRRINTMDDRIQELEETVEELQAGPRQQDGKQQKVGQIVRAGLNVASGKPAVKLGVGQIVQATGVSRRYAYDLMDDLPTEYEWFLTPEEMEQYGSIQIDNWDDRRLGIDIDGVHSVGCPVNKFTTRRADRRGSE